MRHEKRCAPSHTIAPHTPVQTMPVTTVATPHPCVPHHFDPPVSAYCRYGGTRATRATSAAPRCSGLERIGAAVRGRAGGARAAMFASRGSRYSDSGCCAGHRRGRHKGESWASRACSTRACGGQLASMAASGRRLLGVVMRGK